jgi:hypothetical protein
MAEEIIGIVGRKPVKILFEDGTYNLEEFHDLFVELEDLTEYKPALQLVGDWRKWNQLKRDWPTFGSFVEEWKEEVRVKLTSEALQKIQLMAKGNDPKALQASRFIAEAGDQRAGAKKGRPSKADREKAATEIARAAGETAEERQRILKVINGGQL